MTWAAVLLLAAGTYAMKAAGPVVLGGRALPPLVVRVTDLLPAALLAALVAVQTLTSDGRWTIDARAAGVAAAIVVAALRGGFLLIVATAVAVTALVRLIA
ncbi:MAG: AzlD domain-containing protein [Thermoleophilia bacterium]